MDCKDDAAGTRSRCSRKRFPQATAWEWSGKSGKQLAGQFVREWRAIAVVAVAKGSWAIAAVAVEAVVAIVSAVLIAKAESARADRSVVAEIGVIVAAAALVRQVGLGIEVVHLEQNREGLLAVNHRRQVDPK